MHIKMSRLLVLMFLSCLAALVSYASVGKLDPQLGLLAAYPQRIEILKQQSQALRKSADGWEIETIISFVGSPGELLSAGVKIRCIVGDLAVAYVPVHRLEEVASLPSVIYMESSIVDHSLLNDSVPAVGGVRAREQLGYTGKGVLIGIVDSGIDWQHPSFRKADGSTRIKCLLDMSETGPVYGGRLYAEDDINSALDGLGRVNEADYAGHGTHVAGIAAGDGSATTGFGFYAGTAPEAELVVVKATRDELGREFRTSDQIAALGFIDSVANALQKPYVVNLSFGGNLGAHDGTTSTERAIDKLVGRGIPGKAVVTVSGNDREENIHAQVLLSQSVSTFDVTFKVGAYHDESGANNDQIQFDSWYEGNKKVAVTILSPGGASLGPLNAGQYNTKNTGDGTIYAWNGFYDAGSGYLPGNNPFNGDRELYIEISDANASSPPDTGIWTLRFSGDSGMIDVWLADATMPVAFVKGSVATGKTSMPGTAANSITVGAFITKRVWQDKDGNSVTFDPEGDLKIGDIATFSNPGPTRDGEVKPEIVAPGQVIASSFSNDAGLDSPASIFDSGNPSLPNALILSGELNAIASGTSMAAPHVTGAVALLLQKYPEATAAQIRDMLTQSANVDSKVGQAPNNDWGWGKLDIYSALQLTPGVEPPADYQLMNAYPNPFKSVSEIVFELPISQTSRRTSLRVYNILGQQVRTLVSNADLSGKQNRFWDGRDDLGFLLAGGVYFIELISGSHRETKKVVFLGAQK